jgi:hypothetical protein
MRTRREHLEKESEYTLETLDMILKSLQGAGGNINLVHAIQGLNDIKQVVIYRQERMKMIFEPDIAYRFAAVVFFDKTENPYSYDQAYGMKKIERWKRSESMNDFFLRQPIVKLMPFIQELDQNLLTYGETVRKIIQQQYDHLSTSKSWKGSTTGNGKM